MATGDLNNNVRKLKTKLKTIKYTDDIDVKGLAEGKPTVYLPIYHHAFTQFSPALTETILKKDVELFGKSDARFMEAIYKILRDEFSYKPPVNKEQFFAKGFAERKVIMCTEVLQQVITRNNKLNPTQHKTSLKTSIRPTSAIDSRNGHTGVLKTKRPSSSKMCQQSDGRDPILPRQDPHVINELTSVPAHIPVRHTAPSITRNTITRHVARSPEQAPASAVQPLTSTSNLQPQGKHVTIRSPRDEDAYPRNSAAVWDLSPDHLQRFPLNPQTPSVKWACPKSVEVMYMEEDEGLEPSVVEIQAPTSESILNSTVPNSDKDMPQQISNLHKCIETLTDQMTRLDSTVRGIQHPVGTDNTYIQALEERIQAQLSNVMARVVLLENRVTMLEVKVSQVDPASNQIIPTDADSTVPSIQQAQQPLSSFAEDLHSVSATHRFQKVLQNHTDLSLAYSPIRKYKSNGVEGQTLSGNEDTFALEDTDDARRSSTPTGMGHCLEESTICANFSNEETNDAVERIKNMMMETKSVLATQKLTADPELVVESLR